MCRYLIMKTFKRCATFCKETDHLALMGGRRLRCQLTVAVSTFPTNGESSEQRTLWFLSNRTSCVFFCFFFLLLLLTSSERKRDQCGNDSLELEQYTRKQELAQKYKYCSSARMTPHPRITELSSETFILPIHLMFRALKLTSS